MIYFQLLITVLVVAVAPSARADEYRNRKPCAKSTTTVKPTTRTPTTATTATTAKTTTTPTTTTTTPTTTTTTPTTTTTTPTTTTTTPTTTTTTPTTTTTAPTTTTTTPTTTTTTTTTAAPIWQCGVNNGAPSTVSAPCATFPWIVWLDIGGFSVCVGTILDATHILTAAYCVSEASSITAKVGEYDASIVAVTEQIFEIDMVNGITVHPDFSFDDRTNNIAVITLTTPIDFSKPCAAPICLNSSYHVTSGQLCQTAGWVFVDNSFKDVRESASITVFRGPDCPAAFPGIPADYFSDPNSQLCGGKPCVGYAASPLFCLNGNRWDLVGVTSFGEICIDDKPVVFSDMSVYYDWISQLLRMNAT
ncbi:Serine protease 56 [Bulinus truncatus]|nr:Serine protease 56 [Bulinus truncatus]